MVALKSKSDIGDQINKKIVGPLANANRLSAQRTFTLMGNCAVPASAEAFSINVTITQPNAAGDLRLFPTGLSLPIASTVNFSAWQARANNTIVALGVGVDAGQITVQNDSVGTVDFILDLNGYFQ